MNLSTVVKYLFAYFSSLCSFPMEFRREGNDAYIAPTKGPKQIVWYFNQLITFTQVPIFSYGLYIKWEEYTTHKLYFRLVFHSLWIIIVSLCCSFQWIFFKRRNEVISLVNQTVLLKTHLETRKQQLHT